MNKAYKRNLRRIDWSKKIDKTAPVVDTIPVMRSHLAAPRVMSDYEAYECPVTGKGIEGRRAHKENLKHTGCRLLEKGEFEECKKNGKNEYLDGIDAAVDACVDEIAAEITI